MDRPLAAAGGRRRWLILGGGALLLAVVAIVVWPALARLSSADRSVERARLRFGTVTRGELVYEVAVQGRVVAASRPTLYAPSAGIVALKVKEGEAVTAGQVLAELESPELANRLAQERASLQGLTSDLGRRELATRQQNLEDQQKVALLDVRVEAARRGLDRAERLAKEGLMNAIDLEAARDEVKVQDLELAQAKANVGLQAEMRTYELADARQQFDRQRLVVSEVERRVAELALKAPFTGLVATVEVEDRDAVVSGQPLLGVVDLTELEVAINIPETYADEVTAGIEAELTLDGKPYRGAVTRVAPEVRNGQVEGRVRFVDGTPPGLRQNQRLSTRIVLDRRADTLKVPRGPFVEAAGGRVAYVVDGNLLRRRAVELGAVSVTEVEVVSGLSVGEEIVLSDLSTFAGAETLILHD
jgi:HlyD family secretion protein